MEISVTWYHITNKQKATRQGMAEHFHQHHLLLLRTGLPSFLVRQVNAEPTTYVFLIAGILYPAVAPLSSGRRFES
jgi:hypothetical protein